MQKYRSLVFPFAILLGIFFHKFFAEIKFLVPYLIFAILLFSFSSFNLKDLKIKGMNIVLLLFQISVSIIIYFLLKPLNIIVAQGVFIGIICPVAASVAVIACILGANRDTVTSYTLLGNVGIAIIAPLYFTIMSAHPEFTFIHSFSLIFAKLTPILILPLIVALLLQKFAPKIDNVIVRYQSLSFYFWAAALMITIGQTIDFIFISGKDNKDVIIALAIASLVTCFIQFATGRFIGKKFGDKIAGGQALGQKNTAMGIWMATTYLNPLSSIFPASYSVWQNIFNSWQIYRHDKIKK